MKRFGYGEKVIVKVRATGSRTGKGDDVDDFFAGVVEGDGPDAGYHVRILAHVAPAPYDGQTIYFTFYDVAPYSKAKLEDLRFESSTARRAIERLAEWWTWGKPKLEELKMGDGIN